MFDKARAKRLIEKLEEEYETLPEINGFGENNHKEQYALIYDYLRTGVQPKKINDKYDLFLDIIDDFESVCEDYEV